MSLLPCLRFFVLFCLALFFPRVRTMAALPLQTFESLSSGAIPPAPWQSAAGVASITDLDAATGEHALSLRAPGGNLVPEVSLPAVLLGESPGFADLWIKPVARTLELHSSSEGVAAQPTETTGVLYLDGAHFLFQRQANRYVVLARTRSAAGQPWWLRLGGLAGQPVDYELEDTGGRAKDWLRLTVRRDLAAGTYDVWINQKLVGVDLVLERDPASHEVRLLHRPTPTAEDGSLAPVLLDDVQASAQHPLYPDADRDALPDVWEAAHERQLDANILSSIDVNLPDRAADLDFDRVPKIAEYFFGSRPTAVDSDADGISDWMEIEHGLTPSSAQDALWDKDGDGFSNLAESRGQGNGNISLPPAGALANVLYIKADHTGVQNGDYHTPFRTLGAALRSTRLSQGGKLVIRGEGGALTHHNPNWMAENAAPVFDNGGLLIDKNIHLVGVNMARIDLQESATCGTITIPSASATPVLVCENIAFENCWGEDGGAFRIVGTPGEVVFRNCRFDSCLAADDGGALYAHASRLTLEDCWFERCRSLGEGGAVHTEGGTQGTVRRTHFEANHSGTDGGAVSLRGATAVPLKFENCVYQGNVARRGGVLAAVDGADASLIQSTLASNAATASGGGGGLFGASSASVLSASGCILWNNSAPGAAHSHLVGGAHTAIYSTFSGWTATAGPAGTGNNGADPLFRADSLLPSSPAVLDSSDPAHNSLTDFLNNPRWDAPGGSSGVLADRGAFEKQPDTDGDGMSDDWETRYALNTLDPTDAESDGDQDGYSNYEEFVDKTDPRSPYSLKAPVVYVSSGGGRDWHPGPTLPSGTPSTSLQGTRSFPFQSIRRAVLACPSHRRIVLLDGTYAGSRNTNMKISETWTWTPHLASTALVSSLSLDAKTIRGLNGAGRVTLDGGGSARLFDLALSVSSMSSRVTLQNLTLRRGFGDLGGAIRATGAPGYGHLILHGCVLNGNRATTAGGAVHVAGASVSLTQCSLSGNDAPRGGAVFLFDLAPFGTSSYSSAIISQCRLAYNLATAANGSLGQGGGLCSQGSYFSVVRTRFDHNHAERHGGALAILSAPAYYPPSLGSGTLLEANSAGARGGALYTENTAVAVVGSRFIRNAAGFNELSGEGGAVFLAHPSAQTVSSAGSSSRVSQFSQSYFTHNVAGQRAGAVAVMDVSPLFTNCAFTENQADLKGGAGGAVAVLWQVPLAGNPNAPLHPSAPRFVHATFARNRAGAAANLHAASLTVPWLINSVFSDGATPPAHASLLGPRQLYGCQLAAPDALATAAEAEVSRRNVLGAPHLAFDWVHLARPVRLPTDSSSTAEGVEPSSAVSFVRPFSDIDNEVRPPAVTGRFNLMRGCDEPGDTDNDTLPDWFEGLAAAFSPLDAITTLVHTHPVTAGIATLASANPTNNADADAYTLTQELLHGGRPDWPESPFSGRDTDGDGLSDVHERLTPGLHWLNPDVNGDGIADGWSLRHFGTLAFDPLADSDEDGLSNADEALAGTDPTRGDSDGDGVPDAWELATGTNPTRTDSDNDGHADVWGLLPRDANGQIPAGLHQPSASEPWYVEQVWSHFELNPGNYFYAGADGQWGLDSMNSHSDTFQMLQQRPGDTLEAAPVDFWVSLTNTLGPQTQWRAASRVNPSLASLNTHHQGLAASQKSRFWPAMDGFKPLPDALASLLGQSRTESWAAQWHAQVRASHTDGFAAADHGRVRQRWSRAATATSVTHHTNRFVSSYRLRCPLPGGAPQDATVSFLRLRGRSAQTARHLTATGAPVLAHPLEENTFSVESVALTLAKGAQVGPTLTLDPHQSTPLASTAPTLPSGYPSPLFFELHQFDRLVPVGIEEVVSDQIAGNEANRLPTATYGGQPNNPMLMAARTGSEARLRISLSLPAVLIEGVYIGVRQCAASAQVESARSLPVLASVQALPAPLKTPLIFTALPGSKAYEVVAGRDQNKNQKLDPEEVHLVFSKTPKTNQNGKPYAPPPGQGDPDLKWIDKIVVVTQEDFADAREKTSEYGGDLMRALYPTAAGLVRAFASGETSLAGAEATEFGVALDASRIPSSDGLSHPLGARWNSLRQATTHRLVLPSSHDLAKDVYKSKGLAALLERALQAKKAQIAAQTTASWSLIKIEHADEDLNFAESDPATQLHVALGKCRFVGHLEISARSAAGGGFEVSSINCYGRIIDLYDFAYGGEKIKILDYVLADPKHAARTQAGMATLATAPWPEAGRVFYTQLAVGTGWRSFAKTITF